MNQPKIIRWEAPPPRARASGRVDWTPVAEELRSHPGEWALVHESNGGEDADARRARSVANAINSAYLTAFRPAGSFEAAGRMNGRQVLVYARFRNQP